MKKISIFLFYVCISMASLAWAKVPEEYTLIKEDEKNQAVNDELNKLQTMFQSQKAISVEPEIQEIRTLVLTPTPESYLPPVPVTSKKPSPKVTSTPAVRNYHLEEDDSKPTNKIKPHKHQLSISREMYYSKYEEPNVMHQEGYMAGFDAKYTYRPTSKDVFYFKDLIDVYRLEGQWATGELDYSSNGTGTMDDKDNMTFDLKGVLGKDLYTSDEIRTTPYIGFGYRFLRDESENRLTSTGHLGYDRLANYYYVPMGFDVLYQPQSSYSIAGNLEFDYLVRGRQISEVGYIPGYNDATNTQKSGFGLKASVKLTRHFDYCNIFGEGFFRYWKIDDSEIAYIDTVTAVIEPENSTEEFGVRLGLEI